MSAEGRVCSRTLVSQSSGLREDEGQVTHMITRDTAIPTAERSWVSVAATPLRQGIAMWPMPRAQILSCPLPTS